MQVSTKTKNRSGYLEVNNTGKTRELPANKKKLLTKFGLIAEVHKTINYEPLTVKAL